MKRAAAACALLALASLSACSPPEARRERGGGPGADTGNRDAIVRMHGGSKMYHRTPCVTTLPECTGPEQTSGYGTARSD